MDPELLAWLAKLGGPLAAFLCGLYFWERKEHKATRDQLSAMQEKRVEEALSVVRAIEASTSQTEARTDAAREMAAAFRDLSNNIITMLSRK